MFVGDDGGGSAALAEGARLNSGGLDAEEAQRRSHSVGRCGNP